MPVISGYPQCVQQIHVKTLWVRRLVWVCSWFACHFVGFAVHRLIYSYGAPFVVHKFYKGWITHKARKIILILNQIAVTPDFKDTRDRTKRTGFFAPFHRFLSRHPRHRFSASPIFTATFLGITETLVTSPAGCLSIELENGGKCRCGLTQFFSRFLRWLVCINLTFVVPYCYLFLLSVLILWFSYNVSDIFCKF